MGGLQIIGLVAFVVVAALVGFALRHREATLGFVARWGVPIMMTLAYATLAITSDVDATGVAWMTIGLAFVFVVWWIFRLLTTRAALSRVIAIGDAERILEIAGKQLAQRRSARARAEFQVPRAFAHEIRGEWRAALTELDAIDPEVLAGPAMAKLRPIAAAIRVAALVELGDVAVARTLADAAFGVLRPGQGRMAIDELPGALSRSRVLVAEGASAEAEVVLGRVIDTILATPMQRATAHHYLSRALLRSGDAGAAAKHRALARRFAPAGSWLAAQNEPETAKPS